MEAVAAMETRLGEDWRWRAARSWGPRTGFGGISVETDGPGRTAAVREGAGFVVTSGGSTQAKHQAGFGPQPKPLGPDSGKPNKIFALRHKPRPKSDAFSPTFMANSYFLKQHIANRNLIKIV